MLIETVQLLGSSELETALERPTFGYVRLTPDNNIELLAGSMCTQTAFASQLTVYHFFCSMCFSFSLKYCMRYRYKEIKREAYAVPI